MIEGINAQSIIEFHDSKLLDPGWQENPTIDQENDLWRWIELNHRYNTLLWNEEDKARRTDVAPVEIAASKRLIDQYNQKRNDAVEWLDEVILSKVTDFSLSVAARLHSESIGSMVDRLSILSLKIFHMREQTLRTDVDQAHVAACEAKLQRLNMQRQDLASCLDQLLFDVLNGRAYFKVYRQFKMYNDPALNPYLYNNSSLAQRRKEAQ